ncbi:putative transposase, partial [Tremellales sp. Uapishka_1]
MSLSRTPPPTRSPTQQVYSPLLPDFAVDQPTSSQLDEMGKALNALVDQSPAEQWVNRNSNPSSQGEIEDEEAIAEEERLAEEEAAQLEAQIQARQERLLELRRSSVARSLSRSVSRLSLRESPSSGGTVPVHVSGPRPLPPAPTVSRPVSTTPSVPPPIPHASRPRSNSTFMSPFPSPLVPSHPSLPIPRVPSPRGPRPSPVPRSRPVSPPRIAPNVSSNLADLQSQLVQITEIVRLQAQLQQAAIVQGVNPPVVVEQQRERKVNAPDTFSGGKGKLNHFLMQCELVFDAQRKQYPDDHSQINFITSYLRGAALTALQPLWAKSPRPKVLLTEVEFLRWLQVNFGDIDQKGVARQQFKDLRQTGSVMAYFSKMRELLAILGWQDEEQNVDRAYDGLSADIKEILVKQVVEFTTLDELVDYVTRLDVKLQGFHAQQKRDAEAQGKTAAKSVPKANPQTAPPVPATRPPYSSPNPSAPRSNFVPQSNNSVPQRNSGQNSGTNPSTFPGRDRHGQLSPEEYERRRREGKSLRGESVREASRSEIGDLSSSIPDPVPILDSLCVLSSNTIPVPQDLDVFKAPGEPIMINTGQAVVAGQLGTRDVVILLDSGSTTEWIDSDFVSKEGISTIQFETPRGFHLADGTELSSKSYVEDLVTVGTVSTITQFKVTPLHGVDLILGMSYLQQNKIVLDFGTLQFSSRLSQGRAESQPISVPAATISSSIPPTIPLSSKPRSRSASLVLASSPMFSLSSKSSIPVVTKVSTKRNVEAWVSFPNNLPVSRPCKWNQGDFSAVVLNDSIPRLFAIDESILLEDLEGVKTVPAFGIVEFTQAELDDIVRQVPEMYHSYIDIFHPRQGIETLAPPRVYDLKIQLKPDAELKPAPLYDLRPTEVAALKDTLDRERMARRIRPRNSPYRSPTFFVPRKDGRHRMVVDFRRLNAATVPDAYPLPLISQITDQLSKSRIFTKLDLVGAYQLLRIAEGYEHLTAFRTQFGMFESLVVRDGLRNAPAVFQHFLNETFADFLGEGVIVYIDDIVIHAPTVEESRRITRRVLDRVRTTSLYLKASKCEFEKTSLKFLGFTISGDGVSADPAYVQGVADFPAPKTVTQVRRFTGLAGFYRRFVPNFSTIAAPLNALTRHGVRFRWEEPQQRAFDKLKYCLSHAPTIAHFNPMAVTIVQTDASVFGWGFVISQVDPVTENEHPVAIESGAFTGAELNYTTTEKEFLAIVMAFRRKRHLLLQVSSTILTDHLNLTYWQKPQILAPRVARWVDLLSGFDYNIVYRPGKQAVVPDALSRRQDYAPDDSDPDTKLVQALPSLDLESTVTTELGDLLHAIVDVDEEQQAEDDLPATHSAVAEEEVPAAIEDNDDDDVQEEVDRDVDDELITLDELLEGVREDPALSHVRDELASSMTNPSETEDSVSSRLHAFSRRLGFGDSPTVAYDAKKILRFGRKIYVPDYKNLRLKILRSHHGSSLAGHQGVSKTLELIQREHCWLGLRRDVEKYVRGCAPCQRAKTSRQRPQGFLQSLEIAEAPWAAISMDFVEELPNSNGFDSILVVVDRLTKWAIFIPTTTRLRAAGLVDLIIDNVITQHGMPSSIVSDRGSKFTSKLWAAMCNALGIKVSLSTAFHPQTDGQTERVNQTLEAYLRYFVNYNQDNWSTLLSRAAFTHNNSIHSAIQMSPFYANFGYNPRWTETFDIPTDLPPVVDKITVLTELHELCRKNIQIANEDYAKYYNLKRIEAPDYNVGDLVLVSLENMKTKRPMKKLDYRNGGPFRILDKIGTRAYRIEFPPSMSAIHNVINVSLLRPFRPTEIPGQSYDPPGPIEIDEDGPSFEVKAILDSRYGKRRQLEYKVEWIGYEGTDEATTWEPVGNIDGSQELIDDFHQAHPDKPSKPVSRKR